MPKTRTRLGRAALVLFSAALTFGLIEATCSAVLHRVYERAEAPPEVRDAVLVGKVATPTVPDPYLGYRIRPGVRNERLSTSSIGLRGGEVAPRPAPGTVRVLLLGGSTAWGYTSRSDSDTLSHHLQAWLAANGGAVECFQGRRFEVLNGAVPGYVAMQNALAYATDRRSLGAHMVVALDGANEVHSAIRSGHAGWPLSERAGPRIESLSQALGAWFSYRLGRLKCVKLARALDPPPLSPSAVPHPDVVAGAYFDGLELLADSARLEGALVVGVLQPLCLLAEAKVQTPFEREIARVYDARMPGRNGYYADCYAAIRSIAPERARSRPNLAALDATLVFRGLADHAFVDDCHLTTVGRERLAEWIGLALLEYVRDHGPPESMTR